jgi:hypothetical protein
VEDEPWGFAPFHYGRWAVIGGGWGWVPGPAPVVGAVYVRPVYAPALVAFVGGGGFAASITIGGGVGVAWFPLGPRDVWVPSYHVSAVYMTNVNVTNSRVINRTEVTSVYNTTIINNNTNVNVNRTYMYQNAPGAVTAVPKASFQNGEPVAKASVQVNAEQIQHPQVVQAAAITPTPRAVAGPGAPAKISARPPAMLANRPVVTRMAPSPRAIPVGHTAPPTPSTYHSMAAVKPATTPPAGRTPGPPNGAFGKPPAAGPPTGQPGKPSTAGNPPPTKFQPPTRTIETPATNPAPAPKFQPPTRENQPPARTNEPPANNPAPPTKFQPPTHDNQPPPNTNGTPTNKTAPNPPAPQTKKPNPSANPPKPPKDSKDKDKDK